MSGASSDCRVPDPTDAKADGAFGANHRAGYGSDRLERIIACARKGWTLAAGEGLTLVQEIDRLRDDLKYAQDLLNRLHDENKTLIEERNAAEANAERRWNDIIAAAKKIERLERILAALRNPSEAVKIAVQEAVERETYAPCVYREAEQIVCAAVAAAEREVAGD